MKRIIKRLKKEKKGKTKMCKPLEKIRNKSPEEILEECGAYNQIPIDLGKISQHYGISIIPDSFENENADINDEFEKVIGMVVVNGDNAGIFYSNIYSINRQRFTVAHEFAHCSLHTNRMQENYIEYRKNKLSKEGIEYEANVFAGELLIPPKFIYSLYNKTQCAVSLAKSFAVSLQVMCARLDYLNLKYYISSDAIKTVSEELFDLLAFQKGELSAYA